MTNPIKRVSQPFPSMILSSIFVFGKGYIVFVCCVLERRAHFQLKTKRLKQKDLSVAPLCLTNLLIWKVGFHQCEAGICSSLVIVKSGYLKIKNAKNCLGPVLLFLGNLKSCLGPPGL